MDTHEPCGWLDEGETEPCGADSVDSVTVQGKVTKARVPVCSKHKRIHNDSFARLRTAGK